MDSNANDRYRRRRERRIKWIGRYFLCDQTEENLPVLLSFLCHRTEFVSFSIVNPKWLYRAMVYNGTWSSFPDEKQLKTISSLTRPEPNTPFLLEAYLMSFYLGIETKSCRRVHSDFHKAHRQSRVLFVTNLIHVSRALIARIPLPAEAKFRWDVTGFSSSSIWTHLMEISRHPSYPNTDQSVFSFGY